MNIGNGIYNILVNDAGVTALVGSGANSRIYPLMIPQKAALPAVIYLMTSCQPFPTKTGVSSASHYLFDLVCIAETYDGGIALADAVRSALDGIKGSKGGITFQHIIWQDSRDEAVTIAGIEKFGHTLTFELRAKES